MSLPGKEGSYRAAWRTTGRGPALADNPNGIEFDRFDGDLPATFVDADECVG